MGPTVGILLPQVLDDEAKSAILAMINDIADPVYGKKFWVNGCPLSYSFGPMYPELLDEEFLGVEERLGWHPKDMIELCAMCNGEDDHLELGNIALAVAKLVNGKVMFGNLLEAYTSDPQMLESMDFFNFDGVSIIGLEAFSKWLAHPDFCMVK